MLIDIQPESPVPIYEQIVQNPNRQAVEALKAAENIFDFEETPVGLEEAYCALLAKKAGRSR